MATKIKNGDKNAKEKFITSNLRLVVKLAHDFNGLGLSLQDLIAEGNIGLMQAIDKYDPSKGTKFGSYASPLIKQEFRKAIQEKGRTIRLPAAAIRKLKKIHRSRTQLKEKLGRDPNQDEIAEDSGINVREIIRLENTNLKIVSIYDPVSDEDSSTLEDLLPDDRSHFPDAECNRNETNERLGKIIELLTAKEREIIVMRFGLEGEPAKTLEEVAQEINSSNDLVQQIETEALAKLRNLIYQDIKSNKTESPFRFSSEILNTLFKLFDSSNHTN